MFGRILVVDDDDDSATALAEALTALGHECAACCSATEALALVDAQGFDVIITDVHMDEIDGIALCAELRRRDPSALVILITGRGAMETAIDAIRVGAFDFVVKPVILEALAVDISRALDYLALHRELNRLREVVVVASLGMIGESANANDLRDTIDQLAVSDATVLITGESGTGKELVARSLHERSPRREHPFVAINCAAMPAALLESELFGHVRGAFTDAKSARVGLILQAGSGTLFLDEIGEMPAEMQAKLLRVLQERTVRPVGGDTESPYRARLVVATNRDLEEEVAEKRFREDLYYRINVVRIDVPALRDRPGDVLLLAQHFVRKIAARTNKGVDGLMPLTAQHLLAYDWPGNVRELENCIERAVALSRTSMLLPDSLPKRIRDHHDSRVLIEASDPSEMITLQEMESRYVRRVLVACKGNKTHAAKVLGIDRRSLYRRLDDFN